MVVAGVYVVLIHLLLRGTYVFNQKQDQLVAAKMDCYESIDIECIQNKECRKSQQNEARL